MPQPYNWTSVLFTTDNKAAIALFESEADRLLEAWGGKENFQPTYNDKTRLIDVRAVSQNLQPWFVTAVEQIKVTVDAAHGADTVEVVKHNEVGGDLASELSKRNWERKESVVIEPQPTRIR